MKLVIDLKNCFALLVGQKDRDWLHIILLLACLSALTEIALVAGIGLLIEILISREVPPFLVFLGTRFEIGPFGLFSASLLLLLLINLILAVFTGWLIAKYSSGIGIKISNRLFRQVLESPGLDGYGLDSKNVMATIFYQTDRFGGGVVMPAVTAGSKVIICLVLIFGLAVYNWRITFLTGAIFGISYLLVYAFSRRRVLANGVVITKGNKYRLSGLNELLKHHGEIRFVGNKSELAHKYASHGADVSSSLARNIALGLLPRYFLEFLVMVTGISYLLYSFMVLQTPFDVLASTAGIFLIAAVKLLPAVQAVYACLIEMSGNIDSAKELIKLSRQLHGMPKVRIDLNNISSMLRAGGTGLTIDCSSGWVVKGSGVSQIDVSLGALTVLKGKSGAGKTSLVNAILGVAKPDKIQLFTNDQSLQANFFNRTAAYVPQAPWVVSGDIYFNISLKRKNLVDEIERMDELLRQLDLVYLAEGQKDLDPSKVSGGEAQRISIARALFSDRPFLVLDEPTSALDRPTARLVIRLLKSAAENKLVLVVSHDPALTELAPRIYEIKKKESQGEPK